MAKKNSSRKRQPTLREYRYEGTIRDSMVSSSKAGVKRSAKLLNNDLVGSSLKVKRVQTHRPRRKK